MTSDLRLSWVTSARNHETHFPLQNLPYGVFSLGDDSPRCGVAIGDKILDLAALEASGLLQSHFFDQPALNSFMAQGKSLWATTRARITELLADDGDPTLKENKQLLAKALVPMSSAKMHLPFKVSGYTDFYASYHHATNVGTMFRGPDNALPPNWLSIPIGYNGRASTVLVSDTPVIRPLGQTRPQGADLPVFGPSKRLDFELEMGAVVGLPSHGGKPLTVTEADELIFGYVLLNDWSARDIQAWEYQPLGPFQAKAFATTIGAWVITKAALEPFRVATPARERPLLPYLVEPFPTLYDIELDIRIRPSGSTVDTKISHTNYREMYYSAAQQLAHHAVGGCLMQTGDILGSGTISGPTKNSYGSLLELTWGGAEPLRLDTFETRTFLEDGDTVTLTGYAVGNGYRIGFGECAGTILPSPVEPDWSKGTKQ